MKQEEPKQETPEQHLELINNNIEEFDKAIESFRQRKSKQETLEEAAERYAINKSSSFVFQEAHKKDFIEAAKWQQQNNNLYSEEEVLKLLHNYRNHFELYRNIQVLPNDFFGWFEQNKKK